MENIPTQSNKKTEEQEMVEKDGVWEVPERKATPEQRMEDSERRKEETEVIRAKIEQIIESSKELGVKGMKKVEDAGGEPGDVAGTKNANDALNTKTEEAAGEVEQKVAKPAEGEPGFTPSDKEAPLHRGVFYTEQKKAEVPKEETVTEKLKRELSDLEREAGSATGKIREEIQKDMDAIRDNLDGKEESPKTKPHTVSDAAMLTNKDLFNLFDTENKNSTETTEKNAEAKKLRKELGNARKAVALTEKSDPKYAEVMKDYQAKKEAMKSVAYEAKKATLLKKGMSEADIETELDKYAREVLVPNFAVAEAAKIQDAKAEDTMLKKIKDSGISKWIYGKVDNYHKLPFGKKMLVSAGLLGGFSAAAIVGGTAGALLGGGVGFLGFLNRVIGSAGTAFAVEKWLKKDQEKWMEGEVWYQKQEWYQKLWGEKKWSKKNRKGYIVNEIGRLRKGIEKGEIKAESLEEAGGVHEEEVMTALTEYKKAKEREVRNENSRTFLAGVMGIAFGSGAVLNAVKQYGELSGVKDLIFGAPKEIPGVEKVKEVAGVAKEQVKATVAPVQEKIIPVAIGIRGPEGALIDNFRDNADVAKAFGWDGKSDLSEWAGAKAGELWNADAKEALKNPQILAQMEKLGFSKDADGYAKMAHRIGKGFIQIDPTDKHIKFTDMEYLKNTTKELKTALGVGVGPQVGAAEYQSLSDLAKATEGVTGTEVPAPLQGAQKILHDLVDQEKLSEIEERMAPHIKELADNMKENGLSHEEIMEHSDEISENAVKLAGIDLSAAKGMINIEALQQIMESPEGKVGGLMQKMVDSKVFTEKDFNSSVNKVGGMNKFMDLKFSDLKGNPVFRSFAEKAYEMYGGSKNVFTFGNLSVRDAMKGIQYERVFGGTAKELMEKTK